MTRGGGAYDWWGRHLEGLPSNKTIVRHLARRAEGSAGPRRLPVAGRRRGSATPRALVAGRARPRTAGHLEVQARSCHARPIWAAALSLEVHIVNGHSVNRLLYRLGYSLQSNRDKVEERQGPDRDEQFQHVSWEVQEFQVKGHPEFSVDTEIKV